MQKYLLIDKFSGYELGDVEAKDQKDAAAKLYAQHPGTENKTDIVLAVNHELDGLPDQATAKPEYL
ncbi:hypothetical protein [Deinococcus wulumuqiensis]|uniref:Uncharacterized protein n=1 Tax=Deinococcus wulumuqiensis TaxID=980427 RepID=A0AAV4K5K0_9DEIO|nr:hypothetical protein [Deinococcus wulumuqiensis]QII20075.1 hypothetical protein G6R31_04315 [Deinococcus wulumuqiensis R12]GGI87412.1 hypothetical protein GCM10010914_22370 [Deinococcus wulumuqiensis]GGP30010.1 hypothetical protein GCM10008021_16610 [Deinococcus wulumuqiensis]